MPVTMGILCNRCRTVHFISPSNNSRIRFDRVRGDFKLTCDPPCKAAVFFDGSVLRPYSVPADALHRGYSAVTECKAISVA